jgi:hypothetical protein
MKYMLLKKVKTNSFCEISGAHGSEYEDDSRLGYETMQSRRCGNGAISQKTVIFKILI